MDPRWLRTFLAVADLGSFSRAADELGYTQSAVSQHVAALEADLGSQLLQRRPVVPTEAGLRLLEHARPILLRLDAARSEVARLAGAHAEQLRLAASPTAAPLLAGRLADVRRVLPRTEVLLRVDARDAVASAVATGAADAGLVDGIAAPSDPLRLPEVGLVEATRVHEGALAVALPAGHPLARRRAVRLEDLVDARWLHAPGVGAPLETLRAAGGSDGFRPAVTYEGTDVRALLALVAAGHGLAVLAPDAIAGAPGVVAVPLAAERLVHRVELLRGGVPGPAADALAAALARS